MPELAAAVRQHAERYDTGDPADTAVYDVLVRAAEVLEQDCDQSRPDPVPHYNRGRTHIAPRTA